MSVEQIDFHVIGEGVVGWLLLVAGFASPLLLVVGGVVWLLAVVIGGVEFEGGALPPPFTTSHIFLRSPIALAPFFVSHLAPFSQNRPLNPGKHLHE
jgi:hypothetical protein